MDSGLRATGVQLRNEGVGRLPACVPLGYYAGMREWDGLRPACPREYCAVMTEWVGFLPVFP